MQESEPSLLGFRRFETPDLSAEKIENIRTELLATQELIADLLAKVDRKIQFKDELIQDDGTNDHAEWKRLGIFIVHEKCFSPAVARTLRENGIDLCEDEAVIELHLPYQKIQIKHILPSFVRLHEYLQANKEARRLPLYIYGISYLAKFAERYGFTVINLPHSVKQYSGAARLLQHYADSDDNKKRRIVERFQMHDIQLCCLSVDEFMDIIGNRSDYSELLLQNVIDRLRNDHPDSLTPEED